MTKANTDVLRCENWREMRVVVNVQVSAAVNLCLKAKVDYNDEGITMDSISKFYSTLGNDFQLIVMKPPKIFHF